MSSRTKTADGVKATSREGAGVEQVMGLVAIGAGGIGAGVIGLWAVACMAGGLVAAGGPIRFVLSWMRAVGGY